MLTLIHRTRLLGFRSMGKFFYAVRKGRKTGVFLTWDECKTHVSGFAGARFKKFGTEEEAWDFVEAQNGYNKWESAIWKPSKTLASSSTCSYTPSFAPVKQNKRTYSTDSEPIAEPNAKRQRTQSTKSSGDSNDGVAIYTDGACTQNGYHGAKAGVGVYWGDGHPLNYSARLEGKQTNQRAELTAAIKALEQVKEHHNSRSVTLYTDSKYTIHCATEWIPRWKRNGWKTTQRTEVLNKPDLVKLDRLNSELDVKWEYVPGHKNISGNEKADQLAREGAAQPLPGR